MKDGLPSRSSFRDRTGPPPRRYGAASFACIYKRRMVDQNRGSWNRITGWLRAIDSLRNAA